MSQELSPALLPSSLTPQSSSPASPRHSQNRTRDLAIFKKVVLENFTHQEVADVYNLDKSRVTQIVARVRRRLAQADRDDPGIHNPLARQRLETQIEQMRLEFVLNTTTEALLKQPTSLSTVKQGTSDHSGTVNKWNIVTTRDIAPTAQLINAYLRVTRRIGELRDSRLKDNPIPSHLQQDDLLKAISTAIGNFLRTAKQFARQPSPEFMTALKDCKDILAAYLCRRGVGFPPAECWPYPKVVRSGPDRTEQPIDSQSPTAPAAANPASGTTANFPGSASSAPQELTNPHHQPPNTHQPLTAPPIIFHGLTASS